MLPGADVLLDCTDNFRTRHLINRASVRHGFRWCRGGDPVRRAVVGGDPRDPHSPCYACLFPETEGLEETRCATMGVFAAGRHHRDDAGGRVLADRGLGLAA